MNRLYLPLLLTVFLVLSALLAPLLAAQTAVFKIEDNTGTTLLIVYDDGRVVPVLSSILKTHRSFLLPAGGCLR